MRHVLSEFHFGFAPLVEDSARLQSEQRTLHPKASGEIQTGAVCCIAPAQSAPNFRCEVSSLVPQTWLIKFLKSLAGRQIIGLVQKCIEQKTVSTVKCWSFNGSTLVISAVAFVAHQPHSQVRHSNVFQASYDIQIKKDRVYGWITVFPKCRILILPYVFSERWTRWAMRVAYNIRRTRFRYGCRTWCVSAPSDPPNDPAQLS